MPQVKNKTENIYSMRGFKHVFLFTLKQTFKNKSYIVALVIFVLMMSLMGPINYFSASGGMSVAESIEKVDLSDSGISTVVLINDTDVEFTAVDVPLAKAELASAGFEIRDSIEGLGSHEAAVRLSLDGNAYLVDVILSKDSAISVKDADSLGDFMMDCFWEARLKDADISTEQLKNLGAGVASDGIETEKDYRESLGKTVSGSKLMQNISAFAILIFIVGTMSVSYIIASVNEEKTSKLVESLLVSVRPAALLMGKIIGMMTYVVTVLLCGYAGSMLSDYIMRNVIKVDLSRYAGPSFDFKIFRDYGIGGLVLVLVTVILGYLISGIISGVFGSACSSEEDIASATGLCMILTVVGYAGAFFIGGIDSSTLNHVAALVPPLSFYTLPVLYVCGRVSFLTVLLSYGIQLLILIGLFLLMARVYRNLILSDKAKPKISQIFRSMKE